MILSLPDKSTVGLLGPGIHFIASLDWGTPHKCCKFKLNEGQTHLLSWQKHMLKIPTADGQGRDGTASSS